MRTPENILLNLHPVLIKYIFCVWNGRYNILCTRNWINSEYMLHNIQGEIYFYPVEYESTWCVTWFWTKYTSGPIYSSNVRHNIEHHLTMHGALYSTVHLMNGWDLKYTFPWFQFQLLMWKIWFILDHVGSFLIKYWSGRGHILRSSLSWLYKTVQAVNFV